MEKKDKPATKSPEQALKEHARELFNLAISDLRKAILDKGAEAAPVSEADYQKFMQSFANRSVKAAATFRETWVRLKGSIFPADDK